MKIVYCGKGDRGKACVIALIEAGFTPVLVVHNEGEESEFSSYVNQADIPVLVSKNINTSEEVERIRSHKPDLIVLSGFTQIIKNKLLAVPPKGIVNLHGGKLPEYRGASVLNWQIMNGEPEIGLSVLYAEDGIDTGDIIAEHAFPLGSDDTYTDVYQKTLKEFPRLLVRSIEEINQGSVKPKKQTLQEGGYWHKRYPEDGNVSWHTMTAEGVHNFIRALTPPCPGAFTYSEGKKVILWRSQLIEHTYRGMAGRIVSKGKDGFIVIAQDRGLLVTEYEVDSKKNDPSALGRFALHSKEV